MSVRKIADRAWSEIGADYNYPRNIATDIIEAAIREATKPLVEALENEDRGHGYLCSKNQYSSAVNVRCDCGYDEVLAALAEWRAK